MIKIPSLNEILSKAEKSFYRYPLAILCSMFAAIIGIYLVATESKDIPFRMINVMLSFLLGIPLFFALGTYAVKKSLRFNLKAMVYGIGAITLLLIYLLFPVDKASGSIAIPYIRYVIFNVIIHLVVAFIPYIAGGSLNGFWQYNKSLFIRILEAILYSGFLFVGLSMALGAIDLLFDVDLDEKLYVYLFLFIVGFFNTWFFVSGTPTDFDKLDEDYKLTKGLKVFSQYVLLPLLSIYLLILYSYTIKILISWNWPEGIVSYMIICVAVVGIFLMLLLFPYQRLEEHKWLKKLSYGYYAVLLPLVAVLFIAIGMRIGDYGITINRYLIVLLGVWLVVVCVYFLVGKKNIKFIPISLAAFLAISSFGPWSIFSVAERSQVNRLMKILDENGFIENEKIVKQVPFEVTEEKDILAVKDEYPNESLLTDSLHSEVKSIIIYLDDFHDLDALHPYIDQNLDSMIIEVKKADRYAPRAEIYLQAIGLKNYRPRSKENNMYFTVKEKRTKIVEGFRYFVAIDVSQSSVMRNRDDSFQIDSTSFRFELEEMNLVFYKEEEDIGSVNLEPLINQIVNRYGRNNYYDIDPEKMALNLEASEFNLKILIQNLSIRQNGSQLSLERLDADILIE